MSRPLIFSLFSVFNVGVWSLIFNVVWASTAHGQISSSQLVQPASLEVLDTMQTTLEAIEPAILNLQVTEPFSIVATPPVPNGFSDPAGTVRTGFLIYNGDEVTHGNALQVNQIGSVDIGVRMRVSRPQSYPPGRYIYNVLLTVTPQ
jgi:hypothetical protein